jgi:hypothetical protein
MTVGSRIHKMTAQIVKVIFRFSRLQDYFVGVFRICFPRSKEVAARPIDIGSDHER